MVSRFPKLQIFLVLLCGFLSAPAYATAGAQPPGLSLIPMVLIFGVFYFFIIRPQRKKMKEHELMLSSIKNGDKVITSSGIIGTVTSIQETPVYSFTLEIAPGVHIDVLRTHISDLYSRVLSQNAANKASANRDQSKENKEEDSKRGEKKTSK